MEKCKTFGICCSLMRTANRGIKKCKGQRYNPEHAVTLQRLSIKLMAECLWQLTYAEELRCRKSSYRGLGLAT
jgi:hypothetical protein